MRVLGNSARSVMLLLGTEQLVLGLAGVAAGVLLNQVYYKELAAGVWLASGLYFLGNLAGILGGCVAVARRNSLALLQEGLR